MPSRTQAERWKLNQLHLFHRSCIISTAFIVTHPAKQVILPDTLPFHYPFSEYQDILIFLHLISFQPGSAGNMKRNLGSNNTTSRVGISVTIDNGQYRQTRYVGIGSSTSADIQCIMVMCLTQVEPENIGYDKSISAIGYW